MARFRGRGLKLRPINSNKEIIDGTLLAVGAATQTITTVGTAVNDYTGVVGTYPIGSKISSIYFFVQVLPTAGTANVDWYFTKHPTGLTLPVAGATGGTTFRKYILHEEKGIPGNAADGAYPLTFKGVIRIPRGRQMQSEGDLMNLVIRGTDIHNACFKVIYKVYR